MTSLQLQLCDIQGRLFELSDKKGYDSISFIKTFMLSHVAKGLDSKFNRLQWAGEEYLLAESPTVQIFRKTALFSIKKFSIGRDISIASGTSSPAKTAKKYINKLLPKL